MTHYARNPQKCRVDVFKPSGKYYDTIKVEWNEWDSYEESGRLLTEYFKDIIKEQAHYSLGKWIFICLEPYHKNAHPQMILPGGGIKK